MSRTLIFKACLPTRRTPADARRLPVPVTPDELSSFENRLAALESRADAAEARASHKPRPPPVNARPPARTSRPRAERMFQQSQTK